MSCKLKIAGACLNQTPIDWENNLKNIKESIFQARAQKVDILCLPELSITGYGCEDLFLSEWLPEKALEKLVQIIGCTNEIAVCIGLPVRLKNNTYNTICFIANQEIKGFYAKQKLAKDGVHYEPRWFTSWKSKKIVDFEFKGQKYPFGHITIRHKGIAIGFEICEDAWRKDRPACELTSRVDLLLNPSASHYAFKKARFRETLVCQSSKQFNCAYLYTNLLGNEAGRMIYDGDVLIARKGKLIARNNRFSFKDFNLLSLTLDFKSSHSKTDIQKGFANQNEEFTKAASLALFDYLRKSKSKGFVLSLSGGADSSTIAILVAEVIKNGLIELGKVDLQNKLGFDLKGDNQKEIISELLVTAYQRTKNSSNETFTSAKQLAESLGATFYSWEIDNQVNSCKETIEKVIGKKLTWENHDITLQNIQARVRSPIIWMLANLNNALLLATSNRSEGAVGYATMDGDTSGSIAPLAGVSKHFILEWLKFAEKDLGYEGLKYVNQLTPTAELRPEAQQQTDEEDLMPYEALLRIEQAVILNGLSPQQVFDYLQADFDSEDLKEWVKKFFCLWTRNQWKRERYAPSFHFDDFNIDPRSWYRFPILSSGYKEELSEL